MKIAYMLTLVILILIVAISGYFIGSLTTFPGRIFTPEYEPTLDIKRLT